MLTLPNLLSGLRLGLTPVLLYLAHGDHRTVFLAVLALSLLSDAVDGILARWLGQTSQLGARLDSWADLLTGLSLPLCAWWLWPGPVAQEAPWLTALVFCYLMPVVLGFVRFRRLTSYHTIAWKVLAWVIAGAAVALLGWGIGWPIQVVLPFVALASLEEIAITIVLPEWRSNVPSLRHALALRRERVSKT